MGRAGMAAWEGRACECERCGCGSMGDAGILRRGIGDAEGRAVSAWGGACPGRCVPGEVRRSPGASSCGPS
eukprot:5376061-Prymnesium_polylepis.1